MAPAVPGVEILGALTPEREAILTTDVLLFLAGLERGFGAQIDAVLEARVERRRRWAEGETLDFRPEMRPIREGDWRIEPVPADLQARAVEITGPVDRKMIINALNSGADCFMADFEDSTSPTWANLMDGQVNLRDAVAGTIAFDDPHSGKSYRLGDDPATLLVRPRGLHLPERHLTVDGRPCHGSLVDFGLYFIHNAAALLAKGSGPYFYLPKLESSAEAALWDDVFAHGEMVLHLPPATIKATVLIETLPAAFEMEEILHALRTHSAGLNCGRWDYIFSAIKARRHDPSAVFPDRSQVGMTQPCMRAYTQLAIRTCHRRGAHAMGGMAAQIPIKGDEAANEAALAKVRADKRREATDGHDGTWVAHPGLVALAREAFESVMTGPNQVDRLREDVEVSAEDLLRIPEGTRTEEGLRLNVRVGIQYLEAWIGGNGCVPLYHLMEDAATAEISRTQVWQWMRHRAPLDDGRVVTPDLFDAVVREELDRIRGETGSARYDAGRFPEAEALFRDLCTAEEPAEFLTLPAYDLLD